MRSLTGAIVVVVAGLVLAAPASAQTPKCTFLQRDDYRQTDNEWSENATSIPFRVIRSSMPDNNPVTGRPYKKSRILRRIVDGSLAWTLGRDSCGFDQRLRIPFAYAGDSGSSASNWEDGINTVDFRNTVNGSLLAGHCPDPKKYMLLGCEHTRSKDGVIRETDIGFNKTADWWIGARPPQRTANDLWSLATHEFGHSLEIAHPNADPDDNPGMREQVMYTPLREGHTRRYLGIYDFISMCATTGCRNNP